MGSKISSASLGPDITTAEIADGAVTAAKLADTAVTPGSYTKASLTVDQKGRLTAASNGSIVSGDLPNDGVTDAKLRNSGALSVIGRSANSSGDPADIAAGAASAAVLRESGSVLGFGTVATAGLADGAVTSSKVDGTFLATLATLTGSQALTNKTVALGSNTVSGTVAQFNTALSDGDFATLAGAEVLASKTLTAPTIADFTNAAHDHIDADDGGQLTVQAHSDYAHGSVTYAAGNFTAQAGNWTVDAGDQTVLYYERIGSRVDLHFLIQNTDVSATPTYLSMALPNSYTAACAQSGVFWYRNAGGTWAVGLWSLDSVGIGALRLYRDPAGTAWSTTTADDTSIRGVAPIAIQQ